MKASADFRKILPDLIVILLFVVISFLYFAPAVIDGREIAQHDSLAAIGQGQEQRDYMERHNGERSRWNISMFSGMPSYQMSPPTTPRSRRTWQRRPTLSFFPTMSTCFSSCLLEATTSDARLSGLTAGECPGSSGVEHSPPYFFILVAAGHIWKFITLAYIPPTIRAWSTSTGRNIYLGDCSSCSSPLSRSRPTISR